LWRSKSRKFCPKGEGRLIGRSTGRSAAGRAQAPRRLPSAYALKGETERAAAELAEAQKLTADDRYSSIARLLAVQYVGVPKIRDLFENTFLVGLRRAGLPEE
jgi:hypothetical protein